MIPFWRVAASSGLFRADRLHHIGDSWINAKLRRPQMRRDSSAADRESRPRTADGGLGMTAVTLPPKPAKASGLPTKTVGTT
jgi:hypothetical protein